MGLSTGQISSIQCPQHKGTTHGNDAPFKPFNEEWLDMLGVEAL